MKKGPQQQRPREIRKSSTAHRLLECQLGPLGQMAVWELLQRTRRCPRWLLDGIVGAKYRRGLYCENGD